MYHMCFAIFPAGFHMDLRICAPTGFTQAGRQTHTHTIRQTDIQNTAVSHESTSEPHLLSCENRVQGEVLVRVRPKSTQHRFLKHVHCCEFLAWSPGKWSIDESTAARCRRTFTVLASSNRAGAEVLEIDNCIATRYGTRWW